MMSLINIDAGLVGLMNLSGDWLADLFRTKMMTMMRWRWSSVLIKMQLKIVLVDGRACSLSSTEWLRVTLLTRWTARVTTAAASAELVVVTAVVLVTTSAASAVVGLLWRLSCTASHHVVWIVHVRSSVGIVAVRLHALHLWIDLHGRRTASVHLTAEAATTAATVIVAAAVGWRSAVLRTTAATTAAVSTAAASEWWRSRSLGSSVIVLLSTVSGSILRSRLL